MAINLVKGQKISLEKSPGGGGLTKVVMGLGWDVARVSGFLGFGSKAGPPIDLDASCLLFDAKGGFVDAAWFRQLTSKDGSVRHSGDNRTGAGEGDDEQIVVNLPAVPAEVATLMFLVNSFTGQNFSQVENAFCRIVNGATNAEIARYNLTGMGNHTAQIMAKLYRHGSEWKMHAIGENANGRTFTEMMPAILPHV